MNISRIAISSAIMSVIITVIIYIGSFITGFFGFTAMLTTSEYVYVVLPGAFVGLFLMQLLNFAKLR